MKSCLDEIRELYAKYSPKEIADAVFDTALAKMYA